MPDKQHKKYVVLIQVSSGGYWVDRTCDHPVVAFTHAKTETKKDNRTRHVVEVPYSDDGDFKESA